MCSLFADSSCCCGDSLPTDWHQGSSKAEAESRDVRMSTVPIQVVCFFMVSLPLLFSFFFFFSQLKVCLVLPRAVCPPFNSQNWRCWHLGGLLKALGALHTPQRSISCPPVGCPFPPPPSVCWLHHPTAGPGLPPQPGRCVPTAAVCGHLQEMCHLSCFRHPPPYRKPKQLVLDQFIELLRSCA